jgi:FAD/FMN-containing dehydrogenase
MKISSWGGVSGNITRLARPAYSSDIAPELRSIAASAPGNGLVIGNLRSYGDEALSPTGCYIQTTLCDRILELDQTGLTLTVECGVLLDELQSRLLPLGLMLPVTPGTALVTVGGAIANDVHGKNHHCAGTFGCFVTGFELVRTTGEILVCTPDENSEWFAGTIGGMGLTGAITHARLRLRRVESPLLKVRSIRFGRLEEFFQLDELHRDSHEYTVAWIDCLATGKALGRGIYSVADHLPSAPAGGTLASNGRSGDRMHAHRINVPFTLPISPLNRVTLALLNAAYWRLYPIGTQYVHMNKWLYPLDAVGKWNRLYGPRGFRQFQCVVPYDRARAAITEMLRAISARGEGSLLAVLKNFGSKPSPGLMSFPMPGTTLALDFVYRGQRTIDLLRELHRITLDAGGRIYAAKDACSAPEHLEHGYPNLARFKHLLDPGIRSGLAQRLRVTA